MRKQCEPVKPSSDLGTFWREAFALRGSVTPYVFPQVLLFGGIAGLVCVLAHVGEKWLGVSIGLPVGPYGIGGAILGLLLVLRTNAGNDRWWEARRLWGGIVNQSRNLAIAAFAYGPRNRVWQDRVIRWAAAFGHAARGSLRDERRLPEVERLLGAEAAAEVAEAEHMPSCVAFRLASLLQQARDEGALADFAFLQADRERALLMDHLGGCERILKTPLPVVYNIKIRRYIVIFLLSFPFVLVYQLANDWLTIFITMLVAYPLMSLDQIGIELQNPFSRTNLSHLPLDEITSTIERNLLGLLDEVGEARDGGGERGAVAAGRREGQQGGQPGAPLPDGFGKLPPVG